MLDLLIGRVCLITGASRGIGYGIAARFRGQGAHVVITGRKQETLETAADRLRLEVVGSGEVIPVVANAGSSEAAESCLDEVITRLGQVDVLVNNAATNPYFGDLLDIDLARALKTTQVNQFGPVCWSRAVWRAWMQQNGGVIVNVASVGGRMVAPGAGWYNAAKSALMLMTRQLAYELAPSVRVNAVAPGLIETAFTSAMPAEHRESLAAKLPLRRLGTVDDVADAVLFLSTSQSAWMTGQSLVIDGGALTLPVGLNDSGWMSPTSPRSSSEATSAHERKQPS